MSLLEQLDAKLKLNCTAQERAELLGEKACYLARAGDFGGAATVIREMRSHWGDGSDVRAMVWLMLAEGLQHYYEQLSDEAWDRIRRACSIAKAANLSRLYPLTFAWLAHMEFFRSDYESMGRLLAESRTALGADSTDVKLRSALVLADAAIFASDRQKAQDWYHCARNLAVSSSDRIAIGALIYNRSMLGLSRELVGRALGDSGADGQLMSQYELELKSASAFDRASESGVFKDQIQINLARASISREDYRSAWQILIQFYGFSATAGRSICNVTADLALCAAGMGQSEEARNLLTEFTAMDFRSLDSDEQVIALKSASRAAEMCGFKQQYQDLFAKFEIAAHLFRCEMNELVGSIAVAAA